MQQLTSAGGRQVIRITLQYVWALSEELESLGRIDSTKECDKTDLVLELFGPKSAIEQLLQNSVFSASLRSTRQSADTLLAQINKYVNAKNWEGTVQPWELAGC